MNLKHTTHGRTYILTDENLAVGDEVFCIARGEYYDRGRNSFWALSDYDLGEAESVFPEDPAVITGFNRTGGLIRTTHGYSHAGTYYKIKEII